MALSAMPSRVRAEQGRTVTARVRGREASKRGVGPNGIGFHPYASVQGRLLETLNEAVREIRGCRTASIETRGSRLSSSPGNDDPGVPTWRPTTARRLERVDV